MISISSIFKLTILILLIGACYFVYKNKTFVLKKLKNFVYSLDPSDLKDDVAEIIDDGADYVALGADTVLQKVKKKNKKRKKSNEKNNHIVLEEPKKDVCVDNNANEVFNIDKNIFTYEEAPYVCKAYGAKLATYDQVKNAYKKGANWCNYGWSANQMALYPIQKKFHDNLDDDEKEKGICGKVGVNGGYFKDSGLKFGVNCYGSKPVVNKEKVVYLTEGEEPPSRKDIIDKQKITDMKDKLQNLEINPFSNDKWSSGSCKRSYLIKDEHLDEKYQNFSVKSVDNVKVEDILEGEKMTEEFYSRIHN